MALDPIRLTPSQGAAAFGNEAVGQLTTNPPSPDLTGPNSPEAKYDRMSTKDRFISVNKDAMKSVDASVKQFVHHPIKSLGPALLNAASSTVTPIIHPIATAKQIVQYYKQRGPIDGTSQLVYTLANVGTAGAILAGAGGAVAALCGVAGAAPFMGMALGAIGVMGLASTVINGAQLVYDEAQAAAPETGVKIPKWVPLVGGKPIFGKTTHQQQVDLIKFDTLNTGGSLLTWGIAKIHGGEAPRPDAPPPSRAKKIVQSKPVTYGAMGATMGGLVAAQTTVPTAQDKQQA